MQVFSEKKERQKEEYIEQIILENYNRYYQLAYSYVHNEEDACDIVQNGAYRALRSNHTLQSKEYAGTWIYRIMLNEVFRYLKQPKCVSYEALQEGWKNEIEYAEDRYLNVDLQRALDLLSVQEKAVIIMKYFEDKKLEEIADILDENVSTIKSRLYRGVKKLKLKLAEE